MLNLKMRVVSAILLAISTVWAFVPHKQQQERFQVATEDQPSSPVWPAHFTQGFVEDARFIPIGTGRNFTTTGTYYYDFERKATLVTRANGKHDRYCGSIRPRKDTACNHLIVSGQRFLVFPELQECCLCCLASQGCGVLRQDWLGQAEYLGRDVCPGSSDDQCWKWNVQGLQSNLYWEEVGTRVPRELYQVPNDLQRMLPTTYSTAAIASNVFDVPEYCYQQNGKTPRSCPRLSVCGLLNRDG